MSRYLTNKLRRQIVRRAIQTIAGILLELYPEYDRPGYLEVSITVQPAKELRSLRLVETLELS